jgi:hypothetical protein
MTVLTRREPPGQIEDMGIPSLAAATPLAPRRGHLRQGIPQALDEPKRFHRVGGVRLKKFEAEDLLDWLEANGRSGRLNYVAGAGFTVC